MTEFDPTQLISQAGFGASLLYIVYKIGMRMAESMVKIAESVIRTESKIDTIIRLDSGPTRQE